MRSNDEIIDQLCRRISWDLGDGATAARLKKCETIIYAQTVVEPKRVKVRQRRLFWVAASVLFLLLPTILFVVSILKERPVPFWLGKDMNENGFVGKRLRTTENDTRKMSFENGSSISIMENTSAKVEKSTGDEVIVKLERGELFLDVEGKESDAWAVVLDNYRVSVLGTKFYVSWHDNRKILDVRVKKGTVLVEGPAAGKVGVAVSADTHYRIDAETGFSAMNDMSSSFYDANSPSLLAEKEIVQAAWDSRDTSAQLDGEQLHSTDASATNGATIESSGNSLETVNLGGDDLTNGSDLSSKNDALPKSKLRGKSRLKDSRLNTVGPSSRQNHRDWMKYFEQGDFHKAITTAEEVGFSSIVETATLDQLWKLMNAARKTGRNELAEIALLTCRQRFSQSRKSALAAFVLGKVYYYGKNDPDSAAKWFQTYLDEAPLGPLAEDAMGRLIVIVKERGSRQKAKSLAKRYLKRYPSGAFSDTCRLLVAK